jgi:hypothetical protein
MGTEQLGPGLRTGCAAAEIPSVAIKKHRRASKGITCFVGSAAELAFQNLQK